jgi:DNA-binding MarR family transcriptional regulator
MMVMVTSAAAEAWRLIYALLFTGEAHARMREACAIAGISPGVLKLLFHLQPGPGVAMRDVAEHFDVDASWVTSVVDELESRGLARRLPHTSDRRVKMVALTEQGDAVRQRAFDHLVTPPPALEVLSAAEQRRLRDLMRKVAEADTRLREPGLHAVTR